MSDKLVLIACSTGGPNALGVLIPTLLERLDAPVVVIQHIPKGFTHSLAMRLDQKSSISVHEAYDGHVLKKGNVYIARGGTHLKLHQKSNGDLYFEEDDSEPIGGLKPCANITFQSAAGLKLSLVCCAVLTGMGSDGYMGIKALNAKLNVYTIAQSKETCVVYGMPKVITYHDMADIILPIDKIGNEINNIVGVF